LHQSLDDVMARAEKSLRELTVTAILQQPGAVSPLCEQNQQPLVMLGLGR
jgi:flavin-binding protein dodecin